jgi:hypothetical protein
MHPPQDDSKVEPSLAELSVGDDEARRALEAVLRDQAERERRRAAARAAPRNTGPLIAAMVVLAAVSLSVWTSPPAWLRPEPWPTPGPERLEVGLRMDMWVAVQRIREFQAERRRLPVTLEEAVRDGADAEGLTYQQISANAFRLVGRRDGIEVVYESTTPLDELTGPAVSSVRAGDVE